MMKTASGAFTLVQSLVCLSALLVSQTGFPSQTQRLSGNSPKVVLTDHETQKFLIYISFYEKFKIYTLSIYLTVLGKDNYNVIL